MDFRADAEAATRFGSLIPNEDTEEQLRRLTSQVATSHERALWKLAIVGDMRGVFAVDRLMSVGQLSGLIARSITCDERFSHVLTRAAPYHDVGMLAICDSAADGSQPTDATAQQRLKSHTIIGGNLLDWSSNSVVIIARECALHHHECYDGTGYPSSLAGNAIPLSARIVSVAIYIDNAVSCGGDSSREGFRVAVGELQAQAGRAFDPRVVQGVLDCEDDLYMLYTAVKHRFGRRSTDGLDHRVFQPLF